MNESDLSLEQQFEIASTRQTISNVSLEELQELFISLYTAMLYKDNVCRSLVANAWGIGSGGD